MTNQQKQFLIYFDEYKNLKNKNLLNRSEIQQLKTLKHNIYLLYEPFLYQNVYKYVNQDKGLYKEDVFQELYKGFLKALDVYEKKGFKKEDSFITYLYWQLKFYGQNSINNKYMIKTYYTVEVKNKNVFLNEEKYINNHSDIYAEININENIFWDKLPKFLNPIQIELLSFIYEQNIDTKTISNHYKQKPSRINKERKSILKTLKLYNLQDYLL